MGNGGEQWHLSVGAELQLNPKQDRQCTYKVAQRCVRVTIVVVENQ